MVVVDTHRHLTATAVMVVVGLHGEFHDVLNTGVRVASSCYSYI